MENNDLYLSKISTGVPGLDDLFYGGLRLPDPRQSTKMDGICIVIRGKQGVAKSDLAMQIMRGADRSIARRDPSESKLKPFFCTLNHRTTEWKRKYRGLEVMEAIERAKLPIPDNDQEIGCRLCLYFKDLAQKVGFSDGADIQPGKGCSVSCANNCKISKMLRQELITYNPRAQSLHWNVGGSSNNENFITSMLDDEDYVESILPTADMFPPKNWYNNLLNYTTQSLNIFKEFQRDMHKKAMELADSGDGEPYFKHSVVVAEGFSIFDNDTLQRLQYDTLVDDMRKVAAVSILVFDERAETVNLKSDIIIELRKNIYEKYDYQYLELQIVKSDLQERVKGWHRYSVVHDMKVHLYPRIESMVSKRFSKENIVTRIERSRLDFPMTLHDRVQVGFDLLQDGSKKEHLRAIMPSLVDDITESKTGQYSPWDEKNMLVHVDLVKDAIEYDNLFYDIREESVTGDTSVLYILLGKNEQNLRKEINDNAILAESYQHIRYWEIDTYYIWPEIVADSVKKYVNRWVRRGNYKKLHIVIDDFQYINQYPFLENELMFVPALVSVCNTELDRYRFKNNSNGEIEIQMSLVCRSERCMHYRMLAQMAEINK